MPRTPVSSRPPAAQSFITLPALLQAKLDVDVKVEQAERSTILRLPACACLPAPASPDWRARACGKAKEESKKLAMSDRA